VDFNQLNKFIGKEMMHQAKSTGLVADTAPGTGKVPAHKA